jgi:phosphoheptose isomerase
MNLVDIVKKSFNDSAALKNAIIKDLSPIIADAGGLISDCLKGGGKILACGNGGSASDADHFVGEIDAI